MTRLSRDSTNLLSFRSIPEYREEVKVANRQKDLRSFEGVDQTALANVGETYDANRYALRGTWFVSFYETQKRRCGGR